MAAHRHHDRHFLDHGGVASHRLELWPQELVEVVHSLQHAAQLGAHLISRGSGGRAHGGGIQDAGMETVRMGASSMPPSWAQTYAGERGAQGGRQ